MTCVWEPDTGCLGAEWEALSAEDQQRALMLATSSLQMLTNYRVGVCPTTIRPCPQPLACGCGGWQPYLQDGQWYNGCPCNAQCKPLHEIDLPGPVGEVSALIIDGVVVVAAAGWDLNQWDGPNLQWDPHYQWSDFRIDNGHLLVWQGEGPSPFPETQDLNKPLSEPGTWGITYSRSYPVGPDAQIAVALMAMEFANACKPKAKCSLPKGVTSVVRSGVTFNIETGLFPGGLTGMQLVDAFILKWAPAGSPNRNATVFNPRQRGPRTSSDVPMRYPLGSI